MNIRSKLALFQFIFIHNLHLFNSWSPQCELPTYLTLNGCFWSNIGLSLRTCAPEILYHHLGIKISGAQVLSLPGFTFVSWLFALSSFFTFVWICDRVHRRQKSSGVSKSKMLQWERRVVHNKDKSVMQLDGAREKTLYVKWQHFHRSLYNHDRLLGERKE